MKYMERINPSYTDFLRPLVDWKILSLKDLKELNAYSNSASGFYKIIEKLEKNNFIESFQNIWSNKKYVYLTGDGIDLVDEQKRYVSGYVMNRDNRFHDSIAASIGYCVKRNFPEKNIYLDHKAQHLFRNLKFVPDILVENNTRQFSVIEVELHQKCRKRVEEIFQYYSDSRNVKSVIYVTHKKSIQKKYLNILEENHSNIDTKKFQVLFHEKLFKRSESVFESLGVNL